jgi:polar amino acid transport system substrate-binding protein
MQRVRIATALSFAGILLASACATRQPEVPREVVTALAPTGKLRVGVYTGSPTSYIAPGEGGSKAPRGIAYELAGKLAKAVGVPLAPVVFPSNDKVLEAFRAGQLDLVLTNATPVRAQFIDFGPTVLELEKGYLVRAGGAIRETRDIDRPGVRVGVSKGSSSETELAQVLKHASLVPIPSLAEARKALVEGRIDAFGTNKAILFEMSDRIPGSGVFGNWGSESIAFGIPKDRPAALEYLGRFVEQERRNGGVRSAAERAGVRGLAKN